MQRAKWWEPKHAAQQERMLWGFWSFAPGFLEEPSSLWMCLVVLEIAQEPERKQGKKKGDLIFLPRK